MASDSDVVLIQPGTLALLPRGTSYVGRAHRHAFVLTVRDCRVVEVCAFCDAPRLHIVDGG